LASILSETVGVAAPIRKERQGDLRGTWFQPAQTVSDRVEVHVFVWAEARFEP